MIRQSRHQLLVPAALLLAGCNFAPHTPAVRPAATNNAAPTETPAATGPVTTSPQPFLLRGEVILGHETRSFQPCGSPRQYWVVLPSGDAPAADALAAPGYHPLYGEFVGTLEPAPDDGFAANYDALLRVDHINRLTTDIKGQCQQPPQPTRAFGTEPGWSLSIHNQQASLRRPNAAALTSPVASRDIEPDRHTYLGSPFTLTLLRAQCNDTMSDSLFGWQSTLVWQQQTYTGCATLANTDPAAPWLGHYQSSDTPDGHQLTLNPDHTAVITPDSGAPQASGFWHQAGQDLLSITFEPGQAAASERIYRRDGNSLIVWQETIDGSSYFLGDSGPRLIRLPR